MGLTNATFERHDVAAMDVTEAYDVITAFDAIHDQALPDRVLRNIYQALRPGGVFLMVDVKASTGCRTTSACRCRRISTPSPPCTA